MMALPTSGFATSAIRYSVMIYGNEVPASSPTFEIIPSLFHSGDPQLGEQRTAELMAGYEAGLQAFADAMLQVNGVAGVSVQKWIDGVINGGDITAP